MAYKGFRPDLMGRIVGALAEWPRYYVSIREMADHFNGADWNQLKECFDVLARQKKLRFAPQNKKPVNGLADDKYYIVDHIVPYETWGRKSRIQARCPRCDKPIQGRHGRRNRQHHDDDKCEFDTTKILIEE